EPALSNIQATSTDPYATLRSYFLQNRAAAVRNPEEPETLPEVLPEFPDENGTAAPPATPGSSAAPPSESAAPPASEGAAPSSPAPAPAPPPSSAPRMLVAPDPDAPIMTAGGK